MGNIYDRLDDARQKRARVLETPHPANDGWPASKPQPAFPRLKPPAPPRPERAAPVRRPGWLAPAALALLILAVIFVFAVG